MIFEVLLQVITLLILAVFNALFILEFTKNKRISNRIWSSLICFGFSIMPAIYNMNLDTSGSPFNPLVYILALTAYLGPVWVISCDRFLRKTVVALLTFGLILASEIISDGMSYFVFGDATYAMMNPTEILYFRILSTLVNITIIVAVILINERKHIHFVKQILIVVVSIPLLESMHLWMLMKGYENIGSMGGWITGLILLLMLSYIALFAIEFLRESDEIKEREQQLQAIDIMRRDDERYFSLVQNEIKITSMIRHDIGNQLQQIEMLMALEDEEAAESAHKLLIGINDRLSELQTLKFCDNLLVNTVLTIEKEKYQSEKAELIISAQVPDRIKVEDYDLSIGISSVLDDLLELVTNRIILPKVNFVIELNQETLLLQAQAMQGTNSDEVTKCSNQYLDGVMNEIASKYEGEFIRGFDDNQYKVELKLVNMTQKGAVR